MPAKGRLNQMRLNAGRLGLVSPTLLISIDGVAMEGGSPARVRVDGLVIRDLLNGEPNTATIRCSGSFLPIEGNDVQLWFGHRQNSTLAYGGQVISITQLYEASLPRNVAYDLTCISYEWLLNRRKVTARYTSMDASDIVLDLMATFTSGFTTNGVQPNLGTIDEISFTFEDMTDALDRIAAAVGVYWKVDYAKDLKVFAAMNDPVHDVTNGNVHSATNIRFTTDLSQVRTRFLVQGGGAPVLAAVDPGTDTVPVEDPSWYDTAGGEVVCGAQRFTYGGVAVGAGGALVGSFAVPTAAPGAALAFGTGIETGVHQYAVTFYDGTGETTAGPAVALTHGDIPAPSGTPTLSTITAGPPGNSAGNWSLVYTFSDGTHETTPSPTSNTVTVPSSPSTIVLLAKAGLTALPAGFSYKFYARTPSSGSTFVEVTWQSVDANFYYFAQVSGAAAPSSNTAHYNQTALTNIPKGPTGTTGRRLYRTAAGGSQLKLLHDFADNTTTTLTDSAADATLGANVPTSNTSVLTSTSDAINAGSTSVLVTGTAPFRSAGGWAKAGEQVFRYTAISGSSLTGVPSSGNGSLGSTLRYGTEIVAAPVLTGIPTSGAGAIAHTIAAGDQANLVVTHDDIAAQAVLAGLTGGDGIVEGYLVDQRLSKAGADIRAQAKLDQLKDPIVTVNYETRDMTTRSGRDVTFLLGSPTNLTGTYTIQSVTMSDFDPRALTRPLRTVEASSQRFSFEALVRVLKGNGS